MNQLLKNFRDEYLDLLLSFLWRQWSAIGVSGYGDDKDKWIIDPEALLIFTCTIGRYDPRLFDEVLDWLDTNGRFINIQRLKTIVSLNLFTGDKIISAMAALMAERSKFIKWNKLAQNRMNPDTSESLFIQKDMKPMPAFRSPDDIFLHYGYVRGKIVFRHHTRPVHTLHNTALIFRLRALLGVNARSEVFAYLLTHESGHPRRIAQETFYAQKTIQDLLVDSVHSGLVFVRPAGKEKHYWIKSDEWFHFFAVNAGKPVKSEWTKNSVFAESKTIRLPKEPFEHAQWINWPLLLSALEQVWLKINNKKFLDSAPLLQSSELRILMQEIKPRIQAAGFAHVLSDDAFFLGENYITVFLSDMKILLG